MSLWHELKRRNVVRVAVAYAASAWLILQVVDTVLEYLGHDAAQARILLVLLLVGFLPVVYVSWKFELTAEGLRRDEDVARDVPQPRTWATRFDRAITVLLVVAVSYFAIDKFVVSQQGEGLEKSIAVLPFDDMSPGGDQQYFSDGMAEQLLDQLAKLDNLRVISRSSSFAMRDLNLTVSEIGSRLNVTYVLDGSVRKHEGKVRVSAQLIAAESDEHVWSGTYDGDISDVFGVQDEISRRVVEELKVELLGELPAQWVTSPETYDMYLRGLSLLVAREAGGPEQAAELFELVIEQDPGYAPAYGKLAMARFWSFSLDSDEPVEEAVRRALEIDPDNSDALAIRGRLRDIEGRSAEAEKALLRAIETGPNNPMAYRWLGTLVSTSDPLRYLQYSRRALELNPADPSIWFHPSLALAMLGRYDEARAGAANLTHDNARSTAYTLAAALGSYDGNFVASVKTRYLAFREFGVSDGVVRTFLLLDDIELAHAWVRYGLLAKRSEDFNLAVQEMHVSYAAGDTKHGDAVFARVYSNAMPLWQQLTIAYVAVWYNRHLDIALEIFETILESRGANPDTVDPYNWEDYLVFAQLQHLLGEERRSKSLFNQIEQIIVRQLDDGVVNTHRGKSLYELIGGLLAMKGEHSRAIAMLDRGLELGALCVNCLRRFSQFDSLRPDPGFQQVLAKAAAHAAAQRQELESQGMRLTPEEVLALPSFEFDPHNP